MDLLEAVGKVAGVGGIALAVLLIVFRDVIAVHIPSLAKADAARLLRTLAVLAFVIGIAGVGAWTSISLGAQQQAIAQAEARRIQAAAEADARCREAAAKAAPAAKPAAISAGGNVQAGGDIRTNGDGPQIAAECGSVTAGGVITIGGGSQQGGSAPQ